MSKPGDIPSWSLVAGCSSSTRLAPAAEPSSAGEPSSDGQAAAAGQAAGGEADLLEGSSGVASSPAATQSEAQAEASELEASRGELALVGPVDSHAQSAYERARGAEAYERMMLKQQSAPSSMLCARRTSRRRPPAPPPLLAGEIGGEEEKGDEAREVAPPSLRELFAAALAESTDQLAAEFLCRLIQTCAGDGDDCSTSAGLMGADALIETLSGARY